MSNPGIPKSITEGITTLEEAVKELEEDIKALEERSTGLKVGPYSNARAVPEHEIVELSATKDCLVIMIVNAATSGNTFEVNQHYEVGGGSISWKSSAAEQQEVISFILKAGGKYRWTQAGVSMSVTEMHAELD